jgi:hypothetical protein
LSAEQVRTALERWCYFFKHGAELDPDDLPATLDVPVIRQALEVLVRISQSEIERQRYLEQQRIDRDAASLRADVVAAREELRVGLEAAEGRLRAKEEEARLAQEAARAAQEAARAAQEAARAAQETARTKEEEAEKRARKKEEEARLAQEAAHAAQEAAHTAQEAARRKEEVGIRIGRIQAFQQLLGLPEASRADLGQLAEAELVQLEESLRRQLTGQQRGNGAPPAGPA